MDEFDPQKFRAIVRAIRQMVRCPNCQAKFAERDVEMVTGVGPSYFVKMTCGHCQVSVLASLMQVGQNEITGEVRVPERMINADPISTDDVIEAHRFLNNFDGDFRSIR